MVIYGHIWAIQWVPKLRSTHIFPGFEGLDIILVFVYFEFLIFGPIVVQTWVWDAFQWFQNDQPYRISTKFHLIWIHIRNFRPILNPRIEGVDLMFFVPMGLRVLTLRPSTLGWEPIVYGHIWS